jgi:hypothetical protein
MGERQMGRYRLGALVAVALVAAVALPGCADPGAAPVAVPVRHPCGPEVDPATARVVDVYAAVLGHLVRQRDHGGADAEVLYLVDHAVPELHESGIPEWEKRTPAPASGSTAELAQPVRRCLEGARLDGLPPIHLVEDYDDPAIRSEPVAVNGWPPGQEQPRRYLGGRLFYLGGVPDRGHRLALAASSSGATYDIAGGLFVLQRRSGAWRVIDQARSWVS